MLQKISTIDDWIKEIIKDDPVRKEIPIEERINQHSEIYALWSDKSLGAVTCVNYCQGIPANVTEMQMTRSDFADTVVFYTIWSYEKGCGRDLIVKATEAIKNYIPTIKNVVTLSPKTEMARKFHIRNGAWKYRENQQSINYAYQLEK